MPVPGFHTIVLQVSDLARVSGAGSVTSRRSSSRADSAALLLFVLVTAASCAPTPTARLPIQPDCLSRSQQCKHGWVLVEVDIRASGGVEQAEIIEACPDNSFNWTALDSVKRWRWNPSAEGKQDHQMILCRP